MDILELGLTNWYEAILQAGAAVLDMVFQM
jgi:hypothetical protein